MQLIPTRQARPDRLVATVEEPELPAAPGVERAFTQIYKRVAPNSLNYAEKILQNKEEALDVVGAAVQKTWAVWRKLTPEEMTDAYMYKAVTGEIIRVLAARRRELVSLEDAEYELTQLSLAAIELASRHTTQGDKLDAVLAAMPPRRREVVLLVHVFDFKYHEVAELLGLSIGTVNSHMRLASAEIRAAFKGRFRLGDGDTPKLTSKTGEDSNV